MTQKAPTAPKAPTTPKKEEKKVTTPTTQEFWKHIKEIRGRSPKKVLVKP